LAVNSDNLQSNKLKNLQKVKNDIEYLEKYFKIIKKEKIKS
jgi:hypothetical protein